jgi:hypothetical protein
LGNHYEVTGSIVTKYYGVYPEPGRRAGGTRIAMRKDGTLNYILSDHLGSTSLVMDDNWDDDGNDVISSTNILPS